MNVLNSDFSDRPIKKFDYKGHHICIMHRVGCIKQAFYFQIEREKPPLFYTGRGHVLFDTAEDAEKWAHGYVDSMDDRLRGKPSRIKKF
jgi:hypothetical protein